MEHVHVTSRSSSPSKGSPCSLLQRRHYAEHKGYWEKTKFLSEVDKEGETTYYDSVTGKPLFIAPRGRTFEEFKKESIAHGWPSFRDEEVVWENMRCLANGESVSVDGTHLGHNLPDRNGNRYYIQSIHPPTMDCAHAYPAHTRWAAHGLMYSCFACRYCINLVSVAGVPPGSKI